MLKKILLSLGFLTFAFSLSFASDPITMGMPCSLDTAVSVSGTAGGSSSAPDSVFTLSLWKKF